MNGITTLIGIAMICAGALPPVGGASRTADRPVGDAPAASSALGRQEGPSQAVPPDQLLLKDFRPHSIYNIPQTRVQKARFPIIDMHSHPYARTEEQVERWVRI